MTLFALDLGAQEEFGDEMVEGVLDNETKKEVQCDVEDKKNIAYKDCLVDSQVSRWTGKCCK